MAMLPAAGRLPSSRGPLDIDFSPSLYIPGTLHIVHKMTEGLADVLTWWDGFILYLTHICRLLHFKWNRSRFIETCMNEPPLSAYRDSYKKFDSTVYKGRWGSVLNAIEELLPFEIPLRVAWNRYRFTGGGHGAPREDMGSKSLKVDVVDEAVNTKRFWGYLHMISRLGQTLSHISNWAESCPCHGSDPTLRGAARHHGLLHRLGMPRAHCRQRGLQNVQQGSW